MRRCSLVLPGKLDLHLVAIRALVASGNNCQVCCPFSWDVEGFSSSTRTSTSSRSTCFVAGWLSVPALGSRQWRLQDVRMAQRGVCHGKSFSTRHSLPPSHLPGLVKALTAYSMGLDPSIQALGLSTPAARPDMVTSRSFYRNVCR